MKNSILSFLLLILVCVGCNNNSSNELPEKPTSKWVARILDYRPAPGGFINTTMGRPSAPESIVGKGGGAVTLGGFGGYIIFSFDHRVRNIQGVDFVIHGNAFEGSSEAAAVMVAVDVNKNGVADDPWYELRGDMYEAPSTVHGYTITYTQPIDTARAVDVPWIDNQGGSGAITAIKYHSQCYFPLFLRLNSLSFSGSLVQGEYQTSAQGIVSSMARGNGYADNFSDDYTSIIGQDLDTKNSNKFDIQNTVDGNGHSVSLPSVDFIKVYNCLNIQHPTLGESSPEICGAISLTPVN